MVVLSAFVRSLAHLLLLILILAVSASGCTWKGDDTARLLTLDPDLGLNLRVLLHRWDYSWRGTMGDCGRCCVSVWCFNLWGSLVILCWSLIYNFFDPLCEFFIALNFLVDTFFLVYGLQGLIFVTQVLLVSLKIFLVIMSYKRLHFSNISRWSSLNFSLFAFLLFVELKWGRGFDFFIWLSAALS